MKGTLLAAFTGQYHPDEENYKWGLRRQSKLHPPSPGKTMAIHHIQLGRISNTRVEY